MSFSRQHAFANTSLSVMCFLMVIHWCFLYKILPVALIWNNVGIIRTTLLLIGAFILWHIYALKNSYYEQKLATSGLYKFVAHPLYFLYVAIDIPVWFVVPWDPLAILTSIAFYLSIVITMYFEEKVLLLHYKDAARQHLSRTLSMYRFLPSKRV
jgi:protein-S-isoprenylcysteine O-methyltransferase Ste14